MTIQKKPHFHPLPTLPHHLADFTFQQAWTCPYKQRPTSHHLSRRRQSAVLSFHRLDINCFGLTCNNSNLSPLSSRPRRLSPSSQTSLALPSPAVASLSSDFTIDALHFTNNILNNMSLEWTHVFCLTCDKQTDGTTYCSESCRLAEYERTSPSTSSSAPSSPGFTGPSSYPWSFTKPTTTSTKFYLSPAYDFSNARPYGSTPQTSTLRGESASLATPTGRVLSPSSSHSSLCSMRSTSTNGSDPTQQLSEKAKRELLAYASSFENVRLQRRRSY